MYKKEKRDGGMLFTWNKSYDFGCATRVGICSIYINRISPGKTVRFLTIQSNLTQPGPFNPTNDLCNLVVESGSTCVKAENERGWFTYFICF